jgi:hypothetical protein
MWRQLKDHKAVVLLIVIGMGIAVYVVRRRSDPANPRRYFTPSRQEALTRMSEDLLNHGDYTSLRVIRYPFGGKIEVSVEGKAPSEWQQTIPEFMAKNRMDTLHIDHQAGIARWTYFLARLPFCYDYYHDGVPRKMRPDARHVQTFGSNWVCFVLNGP